MGTETEPEAPTEETYTPAELAELADCRQQMIYNYIRAGRIVALISDNGRYVILASVGDEWLQGYLKRKSERKKDPRSKRS